jgi:hypothetical protein
MTEYVVIGAKGLTKRCATTATVASNETSRYRDHLWLADR